MIKKQAMPIFWHSPIVLIRKRLFLYQLSILKPTKNVRGEVGP